jgi:molecular chaperone GrpE
MTKLKKGPVTELKLEAEKLRSEAKNHNDEYLRSLAEFENFRRRKEREIEEFRTFANENLMSEIIPVLDNLERAIAHKDAVENSENLQKGFEIAYRQMKQVLEKFGLKEFSCLGKEFDPKTCEAISFIETNEQPINTVVQELSKGYMYQDRVIRPARVIVAKPSAKADANKTNESEQNTNENRANDS